VGAKREPQATFRGDERSRYFLDTNILVYASDQRDSVKHEVALRLVHTLLASRAAVVSTQV